MAEISGTMVLYQSPAGGEQGIVRNISFAHTSEIQGGATIASVVWAIYLGNTVTTDVTLSNQAISSDGASAQIQLSLTSAALIGATYTLYCLATLSSGGHPLIGAANVVIS